MQLLCTFKILFQEDDNSRKTLRIVHFERYAANVEHDTFSFAVQVALHYRAIFSNHIEYSSNSEANQIFLLIIAPYQGDAKKVSEIC